MRIFVLVLQIISCVGLIATVLLQSGSSAGLGSIAGGAESLFGGSKKGLDELLSKISTGCAIGFLALTLLLCILS
ncbi:MAG: preprotein translocase subunit SecG [Peptococcaceae bacterium]|nr:preprotein translocase subunit SecG [Peptococcaceae bacterium]